MSHKLARVTLGLYLVIWCQCLASTAASARQAVQQKPADQLQTEDASDRQAREAEVKLGSRTAKGGFDNEDRVRRKFENWRSDSDGRKWLQAMNYGLDEIEQITTHKPHGEKADIELRIRTQTAEKVEGISVKLVSNPRGFNQIDKRWLKTYAQKWQMPNKVYAALQLFVGEAAPIKSGRDPQRMFLDELSETQQRAVIDFFASHRDRIIFDCFAGEGNYSANWILVVLQADATQDNQWRSILCSTAEAARFFGSGEVRITAAGSLKIGRVTVQRKGGDNGRPSAKMLQLKINPAELFELER